MNNEYLYNQLSDMDSIELGGGKPVQSMGGSLGVSPVKGNPSFVSQFDLNVTVLYLKNANGTISELTPSEIPASAKVDIPVYLFGQADFKGGFLNNKSRLPMSPYWGKGEMLTLGGVGIQESPFDPTIIYDYGSSFNRPNVQFIKNRFKDGALVFGWSKEINTGPPEYNYVFAIVECKQVAYGTLLDSTGSDRFTMNMIRYNIADTSKLAQYEKQIQIIEQSLFGKQSNDFISPSAYRKPEQFQQNLLDIPIIYAVTKHTTLATYLNYDVGEILLSVFVSSQKKIE